MFKRIYLRHLRAGDKTHMAYHSRKSVEWISRLTRTGGEGCPAEHYFKWLALIHEVNPGAAIALHDAVTREFEELQHSAEVAEWSPRRSAAVLLRQAAETVNALNDTVTSDDEAALVDLHLKVQSALDACRANIEKSAPKLKGVAR